MTKPARVEWRAVAQDGDGDPDHWPWTPTETRARQMVHDLGEMSTPPYDDVWLERRTVTAAERVA